MKFTQGRTGRVFVIRLEDGDVIPDCIERFAAEQDVKLGHVILLGGVGEGEVFVGPRDSNARPIDPMRYTLDEVHEVAGVGVLASGEDGKPALHVHAALGRSEGTITGCLRNGVKTWTVCEVILYEIIDAKATRAMDPSLGFPILDPGT